VGGETEGACGNSYESGKMRKLAMTRKLIKRMKGELLRRKKERWAGMKKILFNCKLICSARG